MTTFTIAGAARALGTSRASVQRAIRAGKLSATTNEKGERVIDLGELIRVFGPLKAADQPEPIARSATVQPDPGGEQVSSAVLVDLLREQLQDARDLLRDTREQQARLMTLLEAEQAARRELEQKLLPAPTPQPELPRRHHRLWTLLIILVAAIAALVWTRGSAWWLLD